MAPLRHGALRLDPHKLASFKQATVDGYSREGLLFFQWAGEGCHDPDDVEQWDDLCVEYKNDAEFHLRVRGGRPLTLGAFQNLLACIEWVHPRWRGRLGWARAVARAWSGHHMPKHTFPVGIRLARLVGPPRWVSVSLSSRSMFTGVPRSPFGLPPPAF